MYNRKRVITIFCLMTLLFSLTLLPNNPIQPALGTGVVDTWMQGESVSYEISIPDRVPDEIISMYTSDGDVIVESARSSALENDGNAWLITSKASDGTTNIWVAGYFEVKYTSVTQVSIEINTDGTLSGSNDDYWFFPDGVWTAYDYDDAVPETLSVDDTFIRNNKIEFRIDSGATGLTAPYNVEVDQFFLSFNNISGFLRSQYYINDPTSTLHKVEVECFDYGITIQVDVPTGWTYSSITPSATVASTSGRVILTDTVPTTYEIFFTSDDSLRLGSVEEVWNEGFEDTGTNYTVVFEGASALTLTSTSTINPSTTGDYLVQWSHFINSGTLSINGTSYTTTGKWESHILSFDDVGRVVFTATDAVIDNVHIYENVLSSSDPAKGVMYHISPYGLYSYKYGTFYASTTQGASVLSTSTITTSGTGAWTWDTGLASAGSYVLYTYTAGTPFLIFGWGDDASNTTVWSNYGKSVYANMTGWDYKRKITLNTSTPMANYQVKLTFTTAELGNPYTNIETDGDDLRFFDSSGVACDYYIMEDWTNTGTSYVWVEVATSGATYLWMYSGNPSATKGSSLANTFLQGDDFEDGDYLDTCDEYKDGTGTGSVTGGVLTLSSGASGSYYVWFDTTTFSGQVAVELMSDEYASSYSYIQMGVTLASAQPAQPIAEAGEYGYYASTSLYHWYGTTNVAESWVAGNQDWNYHLIRLTSTYYRSYTDNVAKANNVADHTVQSGSTWGFRKFQVNDFKIDWLFVRRFDGTDISDSSVGAQVSTHLTGTQSSNGTANTFTGIFNDFGGIFLTGLSLSSSDYSYLNFSIRSTYNTLGVILTVDSSNYTYNPSCADSETFYDFSLTVADDFASGTVSAVYIQDGNDNNQNFTFDYFTFWGYSELTDESTFPVTVQQLGYSTVALNAFADDQYQLQVIGETVPNQLYDVFIGSSQIGFQIEEWELVTVSSGYGTYAFTVDAVNRTQGYYYGGNYYIYLTGTGGGSYSIAQSGEVTVWIRDVSGHILDFREFTVYSNYSGVFARQYADTFVMSDITQGVNITVYDAFGRLINTTAFEYERVLVIETDICNVKIQNFEKRPVWVIWEYSGGTQSEWVPASGEYEEFLLYIGDYNLTVSYSGYLSNSTMGLNGTSVTYSLTLRSGEDIMVIVNGTILDDILSNLQGTNSSITSLIINMNGDITSIEGDVDLMQEDVFHLKQGLSGGGGNNLILTPFDVFIIIVLGVVITAIVIWQIRDKYKWKAKAENRRNLFVMGNRSR